MNILPLKMTADQVAQARAVLTDPQRCTDNPGQRRLAWLVLKASRGQTVRQTRLNRMPLTAQGGAA